MMIGRNFNQQATPSLSEKTLDLNNGTTGWFFCCFLVEFVERPQLSFAEMLPLALSNDNIITQMHFNSVKRSKNNWHEKLMLNSTQMAEIKCQKGRANPPIVSIHFLFEPFRFELTSFRGVNDELSICVKATVNPKTWLESNLKKLKFQSEVPSNVTSDNFNWNSVFKSIVQNVPLTK